MRPQNEHGVRNQTGLPDEKAYVEQIQPRLSLRVLELSMERPILQPSHPQTVLVQPRLPSSFKTAHGLSLAGSTAHRWAGIAITPATVRPAHGAAIAEREQDRARWGVGNGVILSVIAIFGP
jgi:hypothetical protein